MTAREYFRRALYFEPPTGRIPMIEWASWWDQTWNRWKGEGLPEQLDVSQSVEYFGLDPMTCLAAPVRTEGCPHEPFHGAGIIKNAEQYEQIRPYILQDSGIEWLRYSMTEHKARHMDGTLIIRQWMDGFFWFPRTLLGIENHLFAFYDQPELLHRINRDLLEFHLKTIERTYDVLVPDFVGFAEDMSYNHGPMLSEELFDEFLLPYYRRLIPEIKNSGSRVLGDSDGDITQMIPWLLRAGIEGVYPLERQAGVDIVQIREAYPNFLMLGGYDKMVMSRGEGAMRAEFERILPAMRSGGYIPSVDHQTPPEVSLENYRIYLRLFAEYAQKAAEC